MNVANLQIEGLCMAINAINHALVEKGMLTQLEPNRTLKNAEAIARSDERFVEDLNPSSRDAVCPPIRILEAANKETTPRSSKFFPSLPEWLEKSKSRTTICIKLTRNFMLSLTSLCPALWRLQEGRGATL